MDINSNESSNDAASPGQCSPNDAETISPVASVTVIPAPPEKEEREEAKEQAASESSRASYNINQTTNQETQRNEHDAIARIAEPGNYDIICDTTSHKCFHHVGNRRMRVICEIYLPKFIKTRAKSAKTKLFLTILNDVHAAGGHFLRKSGTEWQELASIKAREKISLMLRNARMRAEDGTRPRTINHVLKRQRPASAKRNIAPRKKLTKLPVFPNMARASSPSTPVELVNVATSIPTEESPTTSQKPPTAEENKTVAKGTKPTANETLMPDKHVRVEQYIMDRVNAMKATDSAKERRLKGKASSTANTFDDENLEGSKQPGPFDVVCSRSKTASQHEGNNRFRALCYQDFWVDAYIGAKTKGEKSRVITRIISVVQKAGGNFLGKKNRLSDWEVLTVFQAKEKVGHTLRTAVQAREAELAGGPKMIRTYVPADNDKMFLYRGETEKRPASVPNKKRRIPKQVREKGQKKKQIISPLKVGHTNRPAVQAREAELAGGPKMIRTYVPADNDKMFLYRGETEKRPASVPNKKIPIPKQVSDKGQKKKQIISPLAFMATVATQKIDEEAVKEAKSSISDDVVHEAKTEKAGIFDSDVFLRAAKRRREVESPVSDGETVLRVARREHPEVSASNSEVILPVAKRKKVTDNVLYSSMHGRIALAEDFQQQSLEQLQLSRENRLASLLNALEGSSPPLLIHIEDPLRFVPQSHLQPASDENRHVRDGASISSDYRRSLPEPPAEDAKQMSAEDAATRILSGLAGLREQRHERMQYATLPPHPEKLCLVRTALAENQSSFNDTKPTASVY